MLKLVLLSTTTLTLAQFRPSDLGFDHGLAVLQLFFGHKLGFAAFHRVVRIRGLVVRIQRLVVRAAVGNTRTPQRGIAGAATCPIAGLQLYCAKDCTSAAVVSIDNVLTQRGARLKEATG